MFRAVTDMVGSLLASGRKRRIIRPNSTPVKVNIGSGLTVAEAWINLDASLNALLATWPRFTLRLLYRLSDSRQWYSFQDYSSILKTHTFVHYDAQQALPFLDESVDFIYTSHLLEHLYRQSAERLLAEAWRVLKPGGYVRVCVPNLEQAFRFYQDGERLEALRLFFTDFDKDPGRYNRHKFMYDYALLRSLLEKVGFGEINRCEYQQGAVPDLDTLDNRPAITLFVEAQKMLPTAPNAVPTDR